MELSNKISGLLLTYAISTAGHAMVKNTHDHETKFDFADEEINQLPLSSLSILDNNQFVLNNDLAVIDWDSFFDSYAPNLKDKQEVILHWAGSSSINPKLLIAMMESQSKIISAPDAESFERPFGDLSDEIGFSEQVKDIADQLSQRFYAFAKLQQNIEGSDGILNSLSTPTSAATVSLTSLLSRKSNNHKAQRKQASSIKSTDVFDVLSAYEYVFAESGSTLLQNADNAPVAKKKAAKAAGFSMRLPWPSGYSWQAGGAHSNTGSGWPYSSLDFYDPNGGGWGSNTPWVQAANSGQVVRFSSCNMRIIHSSGYATNYYHMSNLQYNSGSYVNSGNWIGKYANNKSQALCEGGQSTGPHLHFSLLYNGNFVSLQGHSLSDFAVYVGNSNYDTNCNVNFLYKYGQKYCAGYNLYNNWY